MSCVNLSSLDTQYIRSSESHDINEISEDSIFTTVIIMEQEGDLRSTGYSRFSYDGCGLSPLIVLSMLGNATGLEPDCATTFLFKRHSCSIVSSMCKLIALDKITRTNRDYFNFTRSAFSYPLKNDFNFSFPLIIPSNISSYHSGGADIINKLIHIDTWINLEISKHYGRSYDKKYNYVLANAKFCKGAIYPSTFAFSHFCSNIGSYVVHPYLSSMTKALNTTSIETTTLATIEIITDDKDKDNVTFFTVLSTIIFFTVSVFSFFGYKRYKANKSQQSKTLV
ncbi:hypothetical protein [Candidatus Ichthyocystis sparus]|uniref:hypothetical protein n=1 Tax=Candidatus Ichthyocystis sparus TaxID=1561004 RepID=UPI000B82A4C3|nr:hypothetical protein [Candidatus Ichthyocystis sparus]